MKVKKRSVRNIWMLSREFGSFAGAGGIKDMVAQLSFSLARWPGRQVSVVLPLYGFIDPEEDKSFVPLADPVHPEKKLQFNVEMNYVEEERLEKVQVYLVKQGRVKLYFLDSPRFKEKNEIYSYNGNDEKDDPWKRDGEGHIDYFAMNLLLQKGALQLMMMLSEKPDIIHCHDGHTAVVPSIIRANPWLKGYFRTTGCVVSVHNAGIGYHQEVSDLPFAHAMTGLPWRIILRSRLQGKFDPLIAAAPYAVMNTVSENYARELQESIDDEMTGWFGHHLLDMGVKLEGVTNGIDPAAFRPSLAAKQEGGSHDPLKEVQAKGVFKKAIIEDLSLEGRDEKFSGIQQYGLLKKNRNCPLFTFIGRLNAQKGVDLLLRFLQEKLVTDDTLQILILGRGENELESRLIECAEDEAFRGRVCFLQGYSPEVAQRVYCAGDFLLVPSRYEPCGLTDFIAQLFGNLPIVHAVGGLVKVIDGETGFSYHENSPEALAEAVNRAIGAYQDTELIQKMQRRALQEIEEKYTWKIVMQHYLNLYKKALLI